MKNHILIVSLILLATSLFMLSGCATKHKAQGQQLQLQHNMIRVTQNL